MKIVNHEIQEIVQVPDTVEKALKHIEKIGRICYQSFDKITADSFQKFVKMLFDRKHWAMLEHSWLVLKSTKSHYGADLLILHETLSGSFVKIINDGNDVYLCGNYRAWAELPLMDGMNFDSFMNLPKEVVDKLRGIGLSFKELKGKDIPLDLRAYTVILKTDRAVTHELVRHRPCAFAQESQRYCAYRDELEFVMPYYFHDQNDRMGGFFVWEDLMTRIEEDYQFSLKIGQKPQEARSNLPNCTATQIAVTADQKEWKHIFDLRTSSAAYPPIRTLMTDVQKTFFKRGYLE